MSIRGNLKEQAEKWQDNWRVAIPIYYIPIWQIHQKAWFELQENNKAQVDLKNPAHHILL